MGQALPCNLWDELRRTIRGTSSAVQHVGLQLVAGGQWIVDSGWWLVAGGWWLLAGGWWLRDNGWWLVVRG